MQISEYVTLGHPDKTADFISEYILDRLIEQDPKTRYALEVQIKDNIVTLGGEITTNAVMDIKKWVREAVEEIGYTKEYAEKWGVENTLNAADLHIHTHISEQSNDIAQGVNTDAWGDQGIMFGMAVNDPETDYLPKDFYLAKKLGQKLFESKLGGLDIKTQIVLDDLEAVKKVIVAIPLLNDDNLPKIKDLIRSVIPACDYELIINGTGKYVKHSSMGDCGTTGRKLAVDFYGGNCNVGGGSPWTKDGTKADLTLNMYARHLALEYVKQMDVKYAKAGIGCCIGRQDVDITIWNEKGDVLGSWTEDIKPSELIERFELNKPVYAELCKNGLFSKIC